MTTYKVLAKTGYKGHAEGEEFEDDLTEEEERRAKERGSLRVVKRGDKPEQEDKEEKEGESDA